MDQEQLLNEMWNQWTPYNRGDHWRSYILGKAEADTLETNEDCVTLCQSQADMTIYLL